jgi:2-polyprenyl-3-methyl-5-hydroxy-6-metoxy-1,4-benzoquinol methylase
VTQAGILTDTSYVTNATIQRASEIFAGRVKSLVDRDCDIYGLPKSGPIYTNMIAHLSNPNAHDFRLDDLPALTGDPAVLQSPRSILDVGCGPGTMVWKALRNGHDARGIDLAADKIEIGRAWALAMGGPADWQDRVAVEDAGKLPYANETFDLVSSYHVVEHVSDLRSVLYEAVRVTKRGGWIQLTAPDYRMSYDTHYCMPWPRFMPPEQAHRWVEAMGRPAAGIGSFFYVTGPEVIAVLQALGCRIQTALYREHRDGTVTPFTGMLTADPVIFRSDDDVSMLAAEIKRLQAAGTLPDMYETCLEFTIAAQRL